MAFMPRENIDFVITSIYGQFHWKSIGPIFGEAFCSDKPFYLPSAAEGDAVAELSNSKNICLTEQEQADLTDKTALLSSAMVSALEANVHNLPEHHWQRSLYTQVMLMPVPRRQQLQLF